jgi:hypothetical protein
MLTPPFAKMAFALTTLDVKFDHEVHPFYCWLTTFLQVAKRKRRDIQLPGADVPVLRDSEDTCSAVMEPARSALTFWDTLSAHSTG